MEDADKTTFVSCLSRSLERWKVPGFLFRTRSKLRYFHHRLLIVSKKLPVVNLPPTERTTLCCFVVKNAKESDFFPSYSASLGVQAKVVFSILAFYIHCFFSRLVGSWEGGSRRSLGVESTETAMILCRFLLKKKKKKVQKIPHRTMQNS